MHKRSYVPLVVNNLISEWYILICIYSNDFSSLIKPRCGYHNASIIVKKLLTLPINSLLKVHIIFELKNEEGSYLQKKKKLI